MKSHDAGNLIHSETPLRADGDRDLSPDERQVLDLVNRKVAAAASLDDVMRFLFEATRTIIPCDRLSVHFLDDDGDRMMAQWVRVCYPTALVPVGYVQDMRGSSLRDIVDENVIRIIHDLEKYVVDHPGSDVTRLLVEEGNRSSLTCPLLVDDRVVGILVRGASAVRAFSEHHVLLHQLMAERLGQAVDRGYRNQQLAHANRGQVRKQDKRHYTELYTDEARELVASHYAKDIEFVSTDADKVGQGWPARVVGVQTGFEDAERRIELLKQKYGREKTSAYLRQFLEGL